MGDDRCFRRDAGRVGPWIGSGASELQAVQWIGLRTDADEFFQVAIVAPGFRLGERLGQRLSIEFQQRSGGGYVPDDSSLEIRGPKNELVYWIGISGSAEGLRPPIEIEVTDGEAARRLTSSCIEEWEQRDMRVSVEGEVKTVGYGEVERFGGLAFANGGLDVQTGGTLCSDAFIARALASTWEASRE